MGLVNSMTKAEKRIFQMNMKVYEKNKDYQLLYQILLKKQPDATSIRIQFKSLQPKGNFEICCHHLYKLLIRSLIDQETAKEIETRLLSQYRECKILFQRALFDDCFKLISQSIQMALQHEKYTIATLFYRFELQSLNQLEFKGCSEDELIRKQGNLEAASRHQRSIDNHYSLYNLIRHRQYHQGPTRNEAEKTRLNDLAFNELQANYGQAKNSFESQKIHLLFQSSYFLMTANPRSSLKNYYELNALFEKCAIQRSGSQEDYLSHIEGTLHNLRIFDQFAEMPYFIEKARQTAVEFPGTAIRAQFLTFLYESFIFTDHRQFTEALTHLEKQGDKIGQIQASLALSSLAELQLQLGMIYFKNKNYRQASRELNRILQHGKILQQQAVYPAIRLLMVMIRFDRGDFDFLHYEIRSIEREFSNLNTTRQTEGMILKMIRQINNSSSKEKQKKIIQKQLNELKVLIQNPNEKLRIQTLDLIGWLNEIQPKE